MKKILLCLSALVFSGTTIKAQADWSQVSSPFFAGRVLALANNVDTLIAAGYSGGLFFSTDAGITWAIRDTNITFPSAICVVGTDIYVGTSGPGPGTVQKSTNGGWTFTDVTPLQFPIGVSVSSLVSDGADIFVGIYGTSQTDIYKSSLSSISNGSWVAFNAGLGTADVLCLYYVSGALFVGTSGDGVWYTPPASPSWTHLSGGMPASSNYINCILLNQYSHLFAGNVIGSPELYRWDNPNSTWYQTSTSAFAGKPVYSIIQSTTKTFAGTHGMGVLISQDSGATWTPFNQGFQDSLGNWYCNNQIDVNTLLVHGGDIYAGTECGVWKTAMVTGCLAGVNFTCYKDTFQLLTWNIVPYYSTQVNNAKWSWGDGSSSNGLYPTHTYTTAGVYNICVTAYTTCGDSSIYCLQDSIYKTSTGSMISIQVLQGENGIRQETKNDLIKIHPNPSSGIFTISGKMPEHNTLLRIFNSFGQVVHQTSVTAEKTEVDLSSYPKGLYFTVISDGKKSWTGKIIVE